MKKCMQSVRSSIPYHNRSMIHKRRQQSTHKASRRRRQSHIENLTPRPRQPCEHGCAQNPTGNSRVPPQRHPNSSSTAFSLQLTGHPLPKALCNCLHGRGRQVHLPPLLAVQRHPTDVGAVLQPPDLVHFFIHHHLIVPRRRGVGLYSQTEFR